MHFSILNIDIPYLTIAQMVEVDRLMIEQYRIELIQMMENAGRGLALVAKERFLNNNLNGKRIVVLAGTGGNGGGAMVAARRLASWGAAVDIFVTNTENLTKVPRHQYDILQNIGLSVQEWRDNNIPFTESVDLILDGIIGYSLSGNPRGKAKAMIEWANRIEVPVLSLDTPSGIDLTEGKSYDPTVKASATLTLALPKRGLRESHLRPHIGELYLADISVPASLYAEPSLNLKVPSQLFAFSDIVRIY
ncbi:MAG: NAD(P)H-hydrate epimerase [Bacteroidota bacterium]